MNIRKEIEMSNTLNDYLTDLYQHDLAACEVYKDVIKNLTDESVKKQIEEFLKDHEQHLVDLAALIDEQDGEKPSDWRGLKGVLLDLYAQIRGLTGQTGALKALQTAEELILKQYEEIASKNFTGKVGELIQKNLQDEEKHGHYLNSLNL